MVEEVAAPADGKAAFRLSPRAAAQLDVCVHCGFCLPVCPTYRVLGDEADSPRGRIDMIRAAAEGDVAPSDGDLRLHLERCLDCRACESACPSGVRYGELFEDAAANLFGQTRLPRSLRLLLRMVRHPATLERAMRWGRRLVGLLRLVVPSQRALLSALPPASTSGRRGLPDVVPAMGRKRGEVEIFLGCVQDAAFGRDNLGMAAVLSYAGYEVHLNRAQGCCGALHLHAGDRQILADLGRSNAATYAGTERPVVVCGAGCGAVMKDYGRLFGDADFAPAAQQLARRTVDFSEFMAPALAAVAPPWKGGDAPLRVTYHDPCHLVHAQGISAEPRAILRAMPGIEYVELAEANACCGSAGIYNLVQPELSGEILGRKVENIRQARADVVVTSNPGCALQLRAGLAQAGLTTEVVSLAALLAGRIDPAGAVEAVS